MQASQQTGQAAPVLQSVEAEEAVLGGMLRAFETAPAKVIDRVNLAAADFGFEKNLTIYAAIRDLYLESKPVDELSVIEALVKRGQIEDAGGKHYVSELAAKVPAGALVHPEHYAEIVRGYSLDREKRRIGQHLATNGLAPDEAIEQLTALQRRQTVGAEPSSWAPIELEDVFDGPGEPEPTILARSDGPALLYDGRLHQVSAEPEAGKGWLALRATADLIEAGCDVAYIDFESLPSEIVARYLALGVDRERILRHLVYLRPHEPLSAHTRADFEAVLARKPALVVIDGATEALTIHGLDLADNADIARWLELLPRPAMRSGAAVLMIDHVVKAKEARGRYAIGAQHKLAGIDVAYSLEVVEPFGRGRDGLVRMKVTKDRPGHVRQHSEGEDIALVHLHSDADSGAVTVTLDPPDPNAQAEEFRPTHLMEKVSRAVEETPGMTAREIRSLGGKANAIDLAIRILISEGYIRMEPEGSAHRHYHVRTYVEDADLEAVNA